MASVATLPALEVLHVAGTRVGDAGVALLAGLRTLRGLVLWRTGVVSPVTTRRAERLR
jgi:hypothetical protein